MIRRELEKKVGPVTDEEWKRVCNVAKMDILRNHWLWGKKTSHQYFATVMVTAITIIRKYHPEVNC